MGTQFQCFLKADFTKTTKPIFEKEGLTLCFTKTAQYMEYIFSAQWLLSGWMRAYNYQMQQKQPRVLSETISIAVTCS